MESETELIPLSHLKKNHTAIILGVTNQGKELSTRLLELGFINGSAITCNGKAPFGNPLIFTLHDGLLALRKEDAKNIMVKPL